jgi:transketolase
MIVPTALAAARVLRSEGIAATVLNVPVLKPLDAETVVASPRQSRVVVAAENHTVIGGLGSAVAEALAEAGVATPLRQVGIGDTFAESGSRDYLFAKYGLGTREVVSAVWQAPAINRPMPKIAPAPAAPGEYSPVQMRP